MTATYEILETDGIRKHDRPAALCLCMCGNKFVARITDLKRGMVTSCGCRLRKHGKRNHPMYQTWHGMQLRCNDPDSAQYADYGARGITVCDRWDDVSVFIEDIENDIGPKPEGCQLDRIDNERGYEPGNVRWVTPSQNCRNTRRNRVLTFNGVSQCVSAWAEELGIPVQTILWRLNNGKTVEQALQQKAKCI